VGLFVLVVICLASLVPSSVVARETNERLGVDQPAPFAQTPASAEAVTDRVAFGDLPDGVEQFTPDGDVYFVTVTSPTQSVLSWLAGRNDPAIEFVTREDKFGFQTPTQRREINLQAMRTAEQEAQYVAFTKLGLDAEVSPGEVIVAETLCKTTADDGSCTERFPSAEQIEAADKLLRADGAELGSVEDLTAALEGKEPGDTVELVIDRPDVGEVTVEVELAEAPDEPGRTIVGFRPFDTRVVTLPFEANIETGGIGGPSAGLAFTLSLIDELSPGNLTGGRDVAVTGTIGLDETVGPIGGLAQKVNAVHQHGVDVMLVPASQRELSDPVQYQRLVDAGRGQVEIIPVATLDEALAALEALGGDPLEVVASP
jgi:PDZ domain-containing protein